MKRDLHLKIDGCPWQGRVLTMACGLAMMAVLAAGARPVVINRLPPGAPPPDSPPGNTYRVSEEMPHTVRRVAVLPLATGASSDLILGGETMQPIILDELIKTRRFEVVPVDPEKLRSVTGQTRWTDTEALPAGFFGFLRREYACDAVLFSELTAFRGYAPLNIGWRLKLADARTGKILWASDELFDASDPNILNQVRHHSLVPWGDSEPLNDWHVENSPRDFGRFFIAEVLATLPDRKEMTKVSPPTTDVPSRRPSEVKTPTR